jgi:RsiW-degrading membrane proteinase PrsW (M82 family)
MEPETQETSQPTTSPESAIAPDRGRRRLGGKALTAAGVVAIMALSIVASLELARQHLAEVRSRPDPPVGVWAVVEAGDIALMGLTALVVGSLVAVPGLALIAGLGARARVPVRLIVAAAVAGGLAVIAGGGRVQFVVRAVTGLPPPDHVNVSSVLLTPVVEELLLLLAVAVVLWRRGPPFEARAGLVLGLAVGIGATIVEAALYAQITRIEGGDDPLGQTFAVRFAVLGLNLHPTTAAISGAALGAWLERGPRRGGVLVVGAGIGAAMAIHIVWNLVASGLATTVLAGFPSRAGAATPLLDLFVAASLTAVALLLVAWLVLAVIWRRGGAMTTSESAAHTGATIAP